MSVSLYVVCSLLQCVSLMCVSLSVCVCVYLCMCMCLSVCVCLTVHVERWGGLNRDTGVYVARHEESVGSCVWRER